MKILVVCQYFHPEVFQINDICRQLAAGGHSVTVLTGLPNYPTGVIPEAYAHGCRRDEYYDGVHVIRCFEIGRKKGALPLAMNYLSFWASSLHAVRKLDRDFDLVFVYQLSPVMMGFAGRKYAKKHHVPLLLYCCDLWPESVKAYVRRESSLIFKACKKLSRRMYAACDRIICQSDSFLPYMRMTHGIPEERLTYLPAFADENYLTQDFTPTDDTVDFVFLGNLGMAQDLMAVLSAIESIRDVPGFKVHFVGDGACLADMKRYVAEKQLGDIVLFYGRRPLEEMPAFYRMADACLVSLRGDNMTGLTLPAKVQGYMAAGKPILGMMDGSAKTVIEASQCGVCVGAGDTAGLAAAMKDFILNRQKYMDCGSNGREYFKKAFRMSAFMDRLNAEINTIVGIRSAAGMDTRKKNLEDISHGY